MTSTKLEHAMYTGNIIPTICKIPQHRVGQIARIELVRMPKDRPSDQLLPKSSDKQCKISDKCLCPMGFQRKADTKIPISVRVKTGICETDGMEGQKMFNVHIGLVVQWKLLCVRLHSSHKQNVVTGGVEHLLKEILQIKAVQTCSGHAELQKIAKYQISVLAEYQHCECLIAGCDFVALEEHEIVG